MQEQHVQTTIRPLVSDLITTTRALEKQEAQKRATENSLKKRLQRIIITVLLITHATKQISKLCVGMQRGPSEV